MFSIIILHSRIKATQHCSPFSSPTSEICCRHETRANVFHSSEELLSNGCTLDSYPVDSSSCTCTVSTREFREPQPFSPCSGASSLTCFQYLFQRVLLVLLYSDILMIKARKCCLFPTRSIYF